jgi:hypothetical protein
MIYPEDTRFVILYVACAAYLMIVGHGYRHELTGLWLHWDRRCCCRRGWRRCSGVNRER